MKTDLKAKYIQHLINKKKNDEGFTLIELLVVIIIIGILSAIALPSFLNQANKAKQSEAKTYVGSINRAQQAYFTENASFTDDFDSLGIGIPEITDNYSYALDADGSLNATNAAVLGTATPQNAALKGFAGRAFLTGAAEALTSEAIVCEGDPNVVPNLASQTTCP